MKANGILLSTIAFYTFILLPLAPLHAQEGSDPAPDTIAPSIRHEPPHQAVIAGSPFVIEAVVTDNFEVEEVTLYYRVKGAETYSPIRMEPVNEDLFSVTLPSQEVTTGQIEYYIEATDPSGNISFRGFSFTPLSVAIVAVAPQKEAATLSDSDKAALDRISLHSEPPSPPWYKKWWVWTIVGATVIAGGVAAVSAGHRGGGGDAGKGGGVPPTGSVAIIGPAVGQ